MLPDVGKIAGCDFMNTRNRKKTRAQRPGLFQVRVFL